MPVPPPQIIVVNEWKVACDGGGGALGHPRVWLTLPPETGVVECQYCDRRYVHASVADKAKGAAPAG